MQDDLSRRCALYLYWALAVAFGFGLLALGPLRLPDLSLLLGGPALGVQWLMPLHAIGAAVSGEIALRLGGRRWMANAGRNNLPRRLLWLAIGAALAWWVVSIAVFSADFSRDARDGDGRGFIWLEMLALWLVPASGMQLRRSSAPAREPQKTRAGRMACSGRRRLDPPAHPGKGSAQLHPVQQVVEDRRAIEQMQVPESL